MNIVTCFKQVVGDALLPVDEVSNIRYVQRALEIQEQFPCKTKWFCNTYSTLGSGYYIKNDPIFFSLFDLCVENANNFASQFDVKRVDLCSAWINIANPGGFQEFHFHPSNHFSAVYYIQADKNSGNIIFKNPISLFDMFPIKPENTNQLNFSSYYFEPSPSRFLVFRSNMQHMVAINNSDRPRISIALNFLERSATQSNNYKN